MTTPNSVDESPGDDERRRSKLTGRAALAGVPCREDDIEPTKGLHSVAVLFRVMAGLLFVLMALQVVNGVTSTVEISYGVLFAEAMRLVIFAGLLWGAGDLADLFVKSHYDLRATRILLGRLTRLVGEEPAPVESRPGNGDVPRTRGDGVH